MKVVCDSCHAKYQVPDERVAGKKLKIRCKRCGSMVLIHGDASHADTALAAAISIAPVADDATPALSSEWHVSVDGQNFGPFAQPELLSWLSATPLGWDAYVWREGFAGWIEARTCAELVDVVGGPASLPAPQPTAAEEDGPTRMFQGGPASVFPASQADQDDARPASSPALRAQSSPAFAASRPNPSQAPTLRPNGAGLGVSASYGSSPSLRAGSEPQLRSPSSASISARGAALQTGSQRAISAPAWDSRPDESIPFSTRSLQQVAHSSSPSQPGFANDEGSGLIDIRALAQLARQAPASAAPASAFGGNGHTTSYSHGDAREDSRIVLNPAGAFNRIDSLAPISTSRTNSNALPLAIFGGLALVAAAAFAAIVITRGQVTQPAPAPTLAAAAQPIAAEPVQPTLPAPAIQPAEPEAVAPAPAVADGMDTKEAEAAKQAAPEKPAAPESSALTVANNKPAKRHPRGARSASEDKKATPADDKGKEKEKAKEAPVELDDVMLADKGSSKPAAAKEAVAKEEPAKAAAPGKEAAGGLDDLMGAKPAKQPAKDRSIDDLLDGAVEKKAAAAPAAENLPETPSRDDTLSAMRGVEPAVQACAEGQGIDGTANVQIQVAGASGRVSSANVEGVTGPVGSCIARAVRAAKFPKFSKSSFAVKFPYRIK